MTAPKPLSPPAVHARAAALWDAAVELVRAGDTLREVGRCGIDLTQERIRYAEAEKTWDRLNGRRWTS